MRGSFLFSFFRCSIVLESLFFCLSFVRIHPSNEACYYMAHWVWRAEAQQRVSFFNQTVIMRSRGRMSRSLEGRKFHGTRSILKCKFLFLFILRGMLGVCSSMISTWDLKIISVTSHKKIHQSWKNRNYALLA